MGIIFVPQISYDCKLPLRIPKFLIQRVRQGGRVPSREKATFLPVVMAVSNGCIDVWHVERSHPAGVWTALPGSCFSQQ
jgi:hypothetical protein